MLDYLQYAAVTFGSFAISVDCVVSALFYCQALISSPVLLFLIAFSTFVLNFLLYQWDAYEQFKKFFENLRNMDSKSIAYNVIAVFSGIAMALFTYSIYINFPITFPLWAIITFSVAIGLGTMLLMRNSLEKFFNSFEEMKEKINKNPIFFAVFLVVFVVATLAMAVAWWNKIAAFFMLWGASSFVAQILTYVLCTFLVGAEFVFCADKAANVSELLFEAYQASNGGGAFKFNEQGTWLRGIALFGGIFLMVLNGINNGIMSSSEFVNQVVNIGAMVSGIVLSSSLMLVNVNSDVVKFFGPNGFKKSDEVQDEGQKANKTNYYEDIEFTHRLFAWVVCSAVIVGCLADMSIIVATAPLLGFIAGLDLLVPILVAKMFLEKSDLGFAKDNNVVVLLVALSLCCGLFNFTALTFRACYIASSLVVLFGGYINSRELSSSSMANKGGVKDDADHPSVPPVCSIL